jgi:thiol-disulfide isomerase/thioredoxin
LAALVYNPPKLRNAKKQLAGVFSVGGSMTRSTFVLLAAAVLVVAPPVRGQLTAPKIEGQIDKLRSLPENKRPAATIELARDVLALPAGEPKVRLADKLANLVTEGDQGADALQAVADTLAKSLAETPQPAKGDQPAMAYMELAQLVRYEHVNVTLNDPLFAKALDILAANDAEIEKADFKLKDLHDKPWTLSQLRGKIVMVNFWATWCPPCRAEMPNLDAIYTHYQSQGLVILSITDEEPITVAKFIVQKGYHPPVLIDHGGAVHKQFHIAGIPRTFVYDREGKLVGETIDECTQQQFFRLLGAAGLKPQ